MLGILLIAAFVGNIIPLPFAGYEFFLGSTAVLLIVYRYGLRWGVFAALISGIYTLAIGLPPIFLALATAEALVISIVPNRKPMDLLLTDAIFWSIIALPLWLLFFQVFLGLPFEPTQLKGLLIRGGNGIFNAIAATAIIFWLQRQKDLQSPQITLCEKKISLLAGCFLVPALVIVGINISAPRDLFEPDLETSLSAQCRDLEHELNSLDRKLQDDLNRLGLMVEKGGFSTNRTWRQQSARLKETFPQLLQVYVADATGSMIVPATSASRKLHSRFADSNNLQGLRESFEPVITFSEEAAPIRQPHMSVAVPISRGGRYLGYVNGLVSLDLYQDLLFNQKWASANAILLYNLQGRMLAGSTRTRQNSDPPISESISPQTSGLSRSFVWNSGDGQLAAIPPWASLASTISRSSNSSPWKLVLDIPMANRAAAIRGLLIKSILLMFIPAAGALFIIVRISRDLTLPLARLAKATQNLPQKIKEGQEIAWPQGNVAEVEALVRNFRELTTFFEANLKKLDEFKDSTEEQLDRLLSQKRWEVFTAGKKLKDEMDKRRRIEELLENIESAEAKYRFLLEKTLAGVFIVQGESLSYINPRFAEIFGHSPESLQYSRLVDLVHPDDRSFVQGNCHLQLRDGIKSKQYQFQGVKNNGSTIHVEVLNTKGEYNGQPAILGTLIDITHRKEAEDTIKHMAYHDPLTGLPNRLLFQDRVEQALSLAERNQSMAGLLFMDLDRFKAINDSLGHSAGDQVLKEFADRLRTCVRDSDTVSRFGGDEFNLLLSQITEQLDATLIAGKILKILEEPFFIEGHELYVTSSIGIALYPKDGLDAQSLIKNADTALYRAKDLGRNNFQVYQDSMNPKAVERMALEASLHRVLEREELRVHYQPQVSLATGQIVGMEALIRWEHPDGHLIPPASFIPVAEETGLILPIGEWILRAACFQIQQWVASGLQPLRLGINVSACQFQKQELPSLVARVLEESGASPEWINLEITESVVMDDVKEAIFTLRKLHDVGITVSIDDFGIGQSSLSYLKDFPVEYLKIDRAFVRNLPQNQQEANIARHIVEMAHSLGLRVIAEGVEKVEQLDFLRQLGCDEVQGFIFSPPLPGERFAELLRKENPFAIITQQGESLPSLATGNPADPAQPEGEPLSEGSSPA